MVEHKHAQLIRRYFEACNEGDYDKLVSCFTRTRCTGSPCRKYRSALLTPSPASGCGAWRTWGRSGPSRRSFRAGNRSRCAGWSLPCGFLTGLARWPRFPARLGPP